MSSSSPPFRVVKSNRLLAKITTYLVSFGRLLYLAFLYRWHCLNKISLDWLVTLTTQPSTSKLSDNPAITIVTTNFIVIQIFRATCSKCLIVPIVTYNNIIQFHHQLVCLNNNYDKSTITDLFQHVCFSCTYSKCIKWSPPWHW